MMSATAYEIASRQSSVSGHNCRTYCREVFSHSGSRKRKRSEVVVASDRQSVDIYDIPTSKAVASYNLPKDSSISCSPYSMRKRKQGAKEAQRVTYCALKQPKRELLLFAEDEDGIGTRITSNIERVHLQSASPIVHLDSILLKLQDDDEAGQRAVLAVHEAGQVVCYEQTLKDRHWAQDLKLSRGKKSSHQDVRVLDASLVELEDARKSLLMGQDDILTALDESSNAASALLAIICADSGVSQTSDCLKFLLYAFNNGQASEKSDTPSQDHLRLVISCTIPFAEASQLSSANISLHAASATLQCRLDSKIVIFDLSRGTHRLVQLLIPKSDTFVASMQISSKMIASVQNDTVYTTALPHCSIQDQSSIYSVDNKNTLNDEQSPKHEVRIVSLHQKLGILIVMNGAQIMAVPTHVTRVDATTHRKKRTGLLIDGLGQSSVMRIIHPNDFDKISARSVKSFGHVSSSAEWMLQKQLDVLLSEGKITEFDDLMLNELINDKMSKHRFDERKLGYLISKLFAITKITGQDDLLNFAESKYIMEILMWPSMTCDWLIRNSILTTDRIKMALRDQYELAATKLLGRHAMIEALINFDPTLEILQQLVVSPTPLTSEELAYIVLVVADKSDRLETDSSEPHQLAIRNPVHQLANEIKMDIDSPPPKRPDQFELETASKVIQAVAQRAFNIPSNMLTKALASQLSTSNLRVLIDLLRLETARSGWLSSHEDASSTFSPAQTPDSINVQLGYNTHLMNSAFDAIGVAGWLVNSSSRSNQSPPSTTIPHIKAEISATLQCIEEAAYLQGLLREVLICGKDALKKQPQLQIKAASESNVGTKLEPVKPVTVATRDATSNMLPLGLELRPKFSVTKVMAGGEVRMRSKRDIGRLKSRLVGKYTRERIDI